MSIEAIKSSGVAYQGSAATPEPAKTEAARAVEEPVQDAGRANAGNGVQSLNTNGNEEEKAATNEQIKRAVENINKRSAQTEAVFGVHDGTNRVTIKIIDKESKTVIKEYPPEKTLDMIAKVWEMAGILVDEKR